MISNRLEEERKNLLSQILDSQKNKILNSSVKELLPAANNERENLNNELINILTKKEADIVEKLKKEALSEETNLDTINSEQYPWFYRKTNIIITSVLYLLIINSFSFYLYKTNSIFGILYNLITLIPLYIGYRKLLQISRYEYVKTKSKKASDSTVKKIGKYEFVIMQFSDRRPPPFSFDYYCTFVSENNPKNLIKMWKMDKDKYGEQYGATFIGIRLKEEFDEHQDIEILIRLEDSHYRKDIIELKSGSLSVLKEIKQALFKYINENNDKIIKSIFPLTYAIGEWSKKSDDENIYQEQLSWIAEQEELLSKSPTNIETNDLLIDVLNNFKNGQRSRGGILLYGPAGVGQSDVVPILAKSFKMAFLKVTLEDIYDDSKAKSIANLKEYWNKANIMSPCILMIDGADNFFNSQIDVSDSSSIYDEIRNTFLQEWDNTLKNSGRVMVAGSAQNISQIDNSVLLRFNNIFEIQLPDFDVRKRLLINELKESNIRMELTDEMINLTSGMTISNIKNLVLRLKPFNSINLRVFKDVIESVRANSSAKTRSVTWNEVILIESQKQKLEYLTQKIKKAEQYLKKGLPISKSLLLFGPPGTGKTQIARALATESGLTFLALSTADIKSSEQGKSSKFIHSIFEKARSQSPCLLFVDEIDIVASIRDKSNVIGQEIVGQFLQEMDGINSRDNTGQVFVIGATNNKDDIDPAVLSRFSDQEEISLPSLELRQDIIKINFKNKPISFDLEEISQKLAKSTEGFSGRDLHALVNLIASNAMQRADRMCLDIDNISISEEDLIGLKINNRDVKI